jgi:hypothetical protein
LAKFLASRAQDFWPPVYEGHGLQIGAYIVQFTFSAGDGKGSEMLRSDIAATSKVIPLAERAVQRRVEALL